MRLVHRSIDKTGSGYVYIRSISIVWVGTTVELVATCMYMPSGHCINSSS